MFDSRISRRESDRFPVSYLSGLEKSNLTFAAITYYCFIWSVIEPCMSIIAACLPASAPLINSSVHGGFGTWIRSFKSLFSQSRSGQGSNKNQSPGSSNSPPMAKNSNEAAKFTWRAYQGGDKHGFELSTNGHDEENDIGILPPASDGDSERTIATTESNAPRVSQGI